MVREGILPAEETKFYKSTKIVTTIVGTVRRYVWGACQSYYIANEYYRFYFIIHAPYKERIFSSRSTL